YLPIVRVQPTYPRRALTRGIEGWVLVEFVVTETGTVRDPVVLVADPPGFFERAALRAVVKFKYKPKVAGGKAVAVSGVRSRIVFEMED
ncbi:MAG: energy transducer TonB, partial [Gammaproteobacteria bacterium]|nr:energy transducer TonB [Gammaproteobacteria bacterium]